MLKDLNFTTSERDEIKEEISLSWEIGMTWNENKEQWPMLPEEVKQEIRCEIPQAADMLVKCFNEFILGRVPHGDDYWRNILRFGICTYSQISRNCLSLPITKKKNTFAEFRSRIFKFYNCRIWVYFRKCLISADDIFFILSILWEISNFLKKK